MGPAVARAASDFFDVHDLSCYLILCMAIVTHISHGVGYVHKTKYLVCAELFFKTADIPNVVVDIAPVHSLVARVMGDVVYRR